ncbi:hypothetical protein C7M84_007878 [Penaeus vannamei]|uniref:Uncharacterized protein n=1 Tax=Penaeus vannamei TaxID=6689 RepID=A0A423TB06_PENVA|nr:hypothetical protein C7M84_007878 [Penaeus vannamei]
MTRYEIRKGDIASGVLGYKGETRAASDGAVRRDGGMGKRHRCHRLASSAELDDNGDKPGNTSCVLSPIPACTRDFHPRPAHAIPNRQYLTTIWGAAERRRLTNENLMTRTTITMEPPRQHRLNRTEVRRRYVERYVKGETNRGRDASQYYSEIHTKFKSTIFSKADNDISAKKSTTSLPKRTEGQRRGRDAKPIDRSHYKNQLTRKCTKETTCSPDANVFCNFNVFYNAVGHAPGRTRSEVSEGLRDLAVSTQPEIRSTQAPASETPKHKHQAQVSRVGVSLSTYHSSSLEVSLRKTEPLAAVVSQSAAASATTYSWLACGEIQSSSSKTALSARAGPKAEKKIWVQRHRFWDGWAATLAGGSNRPAVEGS